MADENQPKAPSGDNAPPAGVGDETCDIPAPSVPVEGTCEFRPPDETCDLPPCPSPTSAGMAAASARQTMRAGNLQHPTADGGTGIVTANGGTSAPVEMTVDFGLGSDSQDGGLHTEQRRRGVTEPSSPSGRANAIARAGRYELRKFHAKGGMGEVWLAHDPDIGRSVALKRMLKGRDKQRPEFVKEARVTGQLEHPGIVPIHELGLDEHGQPFYIMKFVDGHTLKHVIKDFHQLPKDSADREVQWRRLLDIFVDLCQTMAYAHNRGVIHRDIKPDNVMVGAYGETLVLDWGLAKFLGEPDAQGGGGASQLSDDLYSIGSIAGTVKGTPHYFAPEVAMGLVDQVDQISDVYLLGATLYFTITGCTPRDGTTLKKLLEDARTKIPTSPRQLDAKVPKPLDAICMKAIAFKKEDRYASASSLAEDVQRYLAGEPVSAYRESWSERMWRWVKRNRETLIRIVGAVLVIGVVAAAALLIRNAEAGRVQAQAKADKLSREDEGRQDIKRFRAMLEEARFYAASASHVGIEHDDSHDASQAEAKAKEAIALAERWGGVDLESMPLETERMGLKKDMYELLLEMAQLRSRGRIEEAEKYLTRAELWEAPTQSFYRLRAQVLSQKDPKRATLDQAKAKDPWTPTTAMDYYLLGEQSRLESSKQTIGEVPEGKQGGLKELLLRREFLTKAMAFYRQALALDPNHYWSHFQLGACYNGLEKHAEAAEALAACIVLQPNAPWSYSSRGLALSRLPDRQSEAEADLDRALQLDPEFRRARLHRAAYYAEQGKYELAEADFAKVLAPPGERRLLQALLARGQMNMKRQKYADARADFQELVQSNLPISTAHLHLTRLFLIDGKTQEAMENLTRFLKLDEKNADTPQAYEARGRELRLLATEFKATEVRHLRERTLRLGLSELEKAVKAGAVTPSVFRELGSTQEKLAEIQPKEAATRIKQAIIAYSRGIEIAPKDHGLRLLRGWALVNLNDNAKAKDDFAMAVQVNPVIAEGHAGLGYTAAKLKAADEAIFHGDQAMLHGAGDYLVLHNVACIYGVLIETDAPRAKRYERQAIGQLDRAIQLWLDGGKTGPDEVALIIGEPAFPERLRKLPEFKKLLLKS